MSVSEAVEQRPVPAAVRHGHYGMVARMVRDFELAAERVTDLDEIPIDLLARFARALNLAERNALARVRTAEEAES
jgi:hypothetical protein